jgi:S1-C subfamily serine protease
MDKTIHSGVLIHEIIGSTFAGLANFKKIDFIQAVDGQLVKSKDEVFEHFSKLSKGGSIDVTVFRAGETLTLKL